jgi:SAM-dependent methyltransferase
MTQAFYRLLTEEVRHGNPYLTDSEQGRVQSHYPVMMQPQRYPPELAATIYASRRSYPVQAILETANPVVFDAGCGYGSESFLFAVLGAKVLAVDLSAEQIAIAQKRQRYYEELFDKALDISFLVAKLDEYIPQIGDLSLTWLASVLAALPDQDSFLKRVYEATRPSGKVMITGMNLWNPLFLWGEWRRRRRALLVSPEFARHADTSFLSRYFWSMVRRKGRIGARYFPRHDSGLFDDVQFFTPNTLSALLREVGFRTLPSAFSGYAPPILFRAASARLEGALSRVPMLNRLGYFYLVTGVR